MSNNGIIRSVLDAYLAEELATDIMKEIEDREKRVCAGYEIIQALQIGKHEEIVIGHNPDAVAPYVCWYCRDRNDYHTGGYCQTYRQALLVMSERLRDRYDWLPIEYGR